MKRFLVAVTLLLLTIGYSSAQHSSATPEVGTIAPNLEGKSPSGKLIKLSDFKGQLVLVDFWASWCPPCRRENPNVVRAYEKFHKKSFKDGSRGFTVFSVSLDKDKFAWLQAIKKDNLLWSNHISDLKGWDSAYAGLYHINSIPNNFLIDSKGKIIAEGLRGQELFTKLEELSH